MHPGIRAVLVAALLMPLQAFAQSPRIAIIIDDLGYARSAGERAIDLPGPLAFAILPGAPSARYLADLAHGRGKEVILHLPLQAADRAMPAEPGVLQLDMTRRQFANAFRDNIDAVPHITGVNSHMGSLLTRHPGHMRWLMEEIGQRGKLFFVDSYTTTASVAIRAAEEGGVPALKRDVFLDAEPGADGLCRAFRRLKHIASQQGFAIGIGHPYPDTLAFLQDALPQLEQAGYELVTVTRLLEQQATLPLGRDLNSAVE
jgi:hypothetical protein